MPTTKSSKLPFDAVSMRWRSRFCSRSRKKQQRQQDRKSMKNFLLGLPSDIIRQVSGFLTANEVTSLFSTCRQIRMGTAVLQNESLLPRHWSSNVGDYSTGDVPLVATRIPVMTDQDVHSIVLKARWRDQGWGNRKGQVWVVAHDLPNDHEHHPIFGNGKIVATSTIAEHHETKMKCYESSEALSFNPDPGKSYYLWYRIGGGGEHQLFIFGLTSYTLVFRNE